MTTTDKFGDDVKKLAGNATAALDAIRKDETLSEKGRADKMKAVIAPTNNRPGHFLRHRGRRRKGGNTTGRAGGSMGGK